MLKHNQTISYFIPSFSEKTDWNLSSLSCNIIVKRETERILLQPKTVIDMYVVCGINIINNVIANYRANYLLLNIIPDSITDWTCQLYAGQNIKYFYFPQNIFEIREDKDWTVTGSTDCYHSTPLHSSSPHRRSQCWLASVV